MPSDNTQKLFLVDPFSSFLCSMHLLIKPSNRDSKTVSPQNLHKLCLKRISDNNSTSSCLGMFYACKFQGLVLKLYLLKCITAVIINVSTIIVKGQSFLKAFLLPHLWLLIVSLWMSWLIKPTCYDNRLHNYLVTLVNNPYSTMHHIFILSSLCSVYVKILPINYHISERSCCLLCLLIPWSSQEIKK